MIIARAGIERTDWETWVYIAAICKTVIAVTSRFRLRGYNA